MLGAKGNSGDMVIKDSDWDNRRNEVSHNDEIWVQRLWKARQACRRNTEMTAVLWSGGLKIR